MSHKLAIILRRWSAILVAGKDPFKKNVLQKWEVHQERDSPV